MGLSDHDKDASLLSRAATAVVTPGFQPPSRLWSRVDRSGGAEACWLWSGPVNHGGYGSLRGPGGMWLAHRLAWTETNGAIPAGLCICHRCDVRLCCNPAHFFLGTLAENRADCVAKGRQVTGERQHLAKLTADDVIAIRSIYRGNNVTQREIAVAFGVKKAAISKVLTRHTWRGVA